MKTWLSCIDDSDKVIQNLDKYPESIALCLHQGMKDDAVWSKGNIDFINQIKTRMPEKVEIYTYEDGTHNMTRSKCRGEIMRHTVDFIEKYLN